MTFPSPEAIQLAKENEWWEIEEAEPDFPVPQSADEFYALWQRLTDDYRGPLGVECFVPLVGTFDLRGPAGPFANKVPRA